MDFDERAGRLIQEIRQSEGLTQADVAQAMAERGFPMHQQTILKIEKGLRPLRLAEALALAEVLKMDLGLFSEEPLDETLSRWANDIQEAELRAIGALEEWVREVRVARESLMMLSESGVDLEELSLGEELNFALDPVETVRRVAHMLVIAEERLQRDPTGGDPEGWIARLREREEEVETLLREGGPDSGEHPEAP
jgi:transcriptional regulator with XRE-family HTH domain